MHFKLPVAKYDTLVWYFFNDSYLNKTKSTIVLPFNNYEKCQTQVQ